MFVVVSVLFVVRFVMSVVPWCHLLRCARCAFSARRLLCVVMCMCVFVFVVVDILCVVCLFVCCLCSFVFVVV